MHGRQKVERTEEENEKKQKEQLKKMTAYKNAMQMIFSKRGKGELDLELMRVISQVLSSNPDIATLWNIRREVLSHFKLTDETHFTDELVPKELNFSEICLKSNPKSYGAWYHRWWLMKQTKFKRMQEEIKLIAKYLQYDDRNFHCWDYRRFLLMNSNSRTLEQELEFTTEKISSNFSNYSSWHLRSTLLPQLSSDFLSKELDLIKNAAFTDPNDQSVWLYHRWILKSQLPKEKPTLIFAFHGGKIVFFVFNISVSIPTQLGLTVSIDDDAEISFQDKWSNPWNTTRSKLWTLDLSNTKCVESIQIWGENLMDFFNGEKLDLRVTGKSSSLPKYFDLETQPKTPEFEAMLRDELAWVQELQELEPDNKWTMSTLILLMRLINFVEFKPQISEFLTRLIELDPKRLNYYHDLRSKYIMEWEIACLPLCEVEELDISELNLTSMYYLERLCFIKKINLSGNSIKDCTALSALQMCEALDLASNNISSSSQLVSSLKNLKELKTLNISSNPVCMSNVADEFRIKFGPNSPYIIM